MSIPKPFSEPSSSSEINYSAHYLYNAEAIEELMKFFDYQHLPSRLQEVSAKFKELAIQMIYTKKPVDERLAGLRKLLEAKDCFVRAAL